MALVWKRANSSNFKTQWEVDSSSSSFALWQLGSLLLISVQDWTLISIRFCQIWSNMKMSDNPTKYEVLIKQYLRSILDISAATCKFCNHQKAVNLLPQVSYHVSEVPFPCIQLNCTDAADDLVHNCKSFVRYGCRLFSQLTSFLGQHRYVGYNNQEETCSHHSLPANQMPEQYSGWDYLHWGK